MPSSQKLLLVLLLASLGLPTPASAHIEVKPKKAPAGQRATLTFIVENESSTAGTQKLDVQLPEGISAVTPRSVRGWKVRLQRSGGNIDRLVLTAPQGREIPAGHNRGRFSFSVALPGRPGAKLPFKVLQTYEDGGIQRWIGSPGSEEPAPTLRLTASKAPGQEGSQSQPAQGSANSTTASDDSADNDEDDGGSGVLIAIVAAIVLAAAVAAWALWRRRRRS